MSHIDIIRKDTLGIGRFPVPCTSSRLVHGPDQSIQEYLNFPILRSPPELTPPYVSKKLSDRSKNETKRILCRDKEYVAASWNSRSVQSYWWKWTNKWIWYSFTASIKIILPSNKDFYSFTAKYYTLSWKTTHTCNPNECTNIMLIACKRAC